tara:strand:+ start:955 stop:1950 length:996 start_codon:yes stop_codon:yes gene_type:complete
MKVPNENDYWSGNVTEEEFKAGLNKYGYEYTPTSSEDSVVIKVAGAQIPCGINIDSNKKEIFKALDWAKENEVDHILTPEGSLSGYKSGWEDNLDHIREALKEVEEHQQKCGVALHLGTNYSEKEYFGDSVFRNEIRHYRKNGCIEGCTYKTMVLDEAASAPEPPLESALRRNKDDAITTVRLLDDDQNPNEFLIEPLAGGLICNDMWGYQHGVQKPVTTIMSEMGCFQLFLHSTNGFADYDEGDYSWEVYDRWHDAFFRMTSWNTMIPILTVDSCSLWDWNGDEDDVDKYLTSSQSGFITKEGWQTQVPRRGRQYFSWDLKIPKTSGRTL